MSVWGGEGIGDAMWKGIDIILRDRANKQAQANADREFQFKQQQAERAQANADRAYEAGREDALRAQGNSDRDFGLRSRTADLDASLKKQDMDLRGRLGDLDAQMKREELEGRKEDRALNREKMSNDLQMQRERLAGEKEDRALRGELGRAELEGKKEDRNLRREESEERRKGNAEDRAFRREEAKRNQGNIEAERQFKREEGAADRAFRKGEGEADRAFRREEGVADRALRSRGLDIQETSADNDDSFRNRQLAQRELESDREYQLKKESQDWANKKAEEEWRTLQTAREELQSANRERKMLRESQQRSMARQLSLAFQQLEDGGGEKTDLLMEDGAYHPARILDAQDVSKIFGVDAAKNFAAVYAIDTPDNGVVFRVMNNDGSFMMNGDKPYFDENARYKIYDRGFGKETADRIFREAGEKRDLGMFAAKKGIEAQATASVQGERGYNSLFQTMAKNADEIFADDEAGRASFFKELGEYGSELLRKRMGKYSTSQGSAEWVGANGKPMSAADVAKLKAAGYEWDAATGRPVRKGGKRVVAPSKK